MRIFSHFLMALIMLLLFSCQTDSKEATESKYEETIGGKAPNVKAMKAPGPWQNYKVLFRAPKFQNSLPLAI